MRISISNIAWETTDDIKVSQLLNKEKVKLIDIAPCKYFDDYNLTDTISANNLRLFWKRKKINIYAFQSLLYNKNNFNIFDYNKKTQIILDYLEKICILGKNLKIKYIVFGSPKNRDVTKSKYKNFNKQAYNFFRQFADIASNYNLIISLEPCPKFYGGNFLINSYEVGSFVKRINHKSLKMHIDTGSMMINRENPIDVISSYSKYIGHIHVSEPGLKQIKNYKFHNKFYKLINKNLVNNKVLSIEMKSSKIDNISKIEGSLRNTISYYNIEKNE